MTGCQRILDLVQPLQCGHYVLVRNKDIAAVPLQRHLQRSGLSLVLRCVTEETPAETSHPETPIRLWVGRQRRACEVEVRSKLLQLVVGRPLNSVD